MPFALPSTTGVNAVPKKSSSISQMGDFRLAIHICRRIICLHALNILKYKRVSIPGGLAIGTAVTLKILSIIALQEAKEYLDMNQLQMTALQEAEFAKKGTGEDAENDESRIVVNYPIEENGAAIFFPVEILLETNKKGKVKNIRISLEGGIGDHIRSLHPTFVAKEAQASITSKGALFLKKEGPTGIKTYIRTDEILQAEIIKIINEIIDTGVETNAYIALN